MADIFAHNVAFGGAFSAEGAVISFGGFGAGLLTQRLVYVYEQKISRIYELGSYDVYLIAGRASGQSEISRIIGPKALSAGFYSQFGNACNAGGNHISFSSIVGCSAGGSVQTISLNFCVLDRLMGQIQVEDYLMHETLTMIFLSMTIS